MLSLSLSLISLTLDRRRVGDNNGRHRPEVDAEDGAVEGRPGPVGLGHAGRKDFTHIARQPARGRAGEGAVAEAGERVEAVEGDGLMDGTERARSGGGRTGVGAEDGGWRRGWRHAGGVRSCSGGARKVGGMQCMRTLPSPQSRPRERVPALFCTPVAIDRHPMSSRRGRAGHGQARWPAAERERVDK